MSFKRVIKIYGEGWIIILKAFCFVWLLMVLLIPLKILELFDDLEPQWLFASLKILIALGYTPFAAYFAYYGLRDVGKTKHKFVPLLDRIKRERNSAPKVEKRERNLTDD